MKTGNLKIRAVTDPHCAGEIEKILVAQSGVRSAAARTGNPGGAEVQYEESRVSLEQLVGSAAGPGLRRGDRGPQRWRRAVAASARG